MTPSEPPRFHQRHPPTSSTSPPPRPCGVPEVELPQPRERHDAGGEGGGAGVAHLVPAAMGAGEGREGGHGGGVPVWGGWCGETGDGESDPSHGQRLGGGSHACAWTGPVCVCVGAPEVDSLEGDEAGQRRGEGRGPGRPDVVGAVCIT